VQQTRSQPRCHDVSERWSERAAAVIPLATQTLSKGPSQWMAGVVPRYLERGRGGHVWDVDGNEWIDFPMALGPVLLGHSEPKVVEAVTRQLRDGIAFTLPHPLEVEVAERIVALCPGVEAVRFAKTGSEATSAAVRAARAHTGRDHVVICGYHGWHDWYAASLAGQRGVPSANRDLVSRFAFNDLDSLGRELGAHEVAAVVLEPSGAALPDPGFLAGVVELCRRNGAVSIFDELSIGFRIAAGGARERYGVQPDLSCYGKALGNGMPIAAIAGSWAVMQEFADIFVTGTHGGEALSLAAAKVVLDEIAGGDVLGRVAAVGEQLLAGFRRSIEAHGVGQQVRVGGEPARPIMTFPGDDRQLVKSWVQQCFAERGALFNGIFMPCLRHSEDDVATALEAFDAACVGIAEIENLGDLLRCEPLDPAYRPV
jgi:glutamate-1-semialdehyde aminotransferase